MLHNGNFIQIHSFIYSKPVVTVVARLALVSILTSFFAFNLHIYLNHKFCPHFCTIVTFPYTLYYNPTNHPSHLLFRLLKTHAHINTHIHFENTFALFNFVAVKSSLSHTYTITGTLNNPNVAWVWEFWSACDLPWIAFALSLASLCLWHEKPTRRTENLCEKTEWIFN